MHIEKYEQSQIKVWDLFVRLFHWSLVFSFTLAYISEDHWLDLHVLAGYSVLMLIALRVIWGFIGSRYARFSNFIKSPQIIQQYILDILKNKPKHYPGHNPAGGAMVLALLASLLFTTLSGMTLYGAGEFLGPLASYLYNVPHSWIDPLEEIHEFFTNLTVLLIVLHLCGVALASLQHGENLARAMLTGKKNTPNDSMEDSNP
jgi:cytochrome b